MLKMPCSLGTQWLALRLAGETWTTGQHLYALNMLKHACIETFAQVIDVVVTKVYFVIPTVSFQG